VPEVVECGPIPAAHCHVTVWPALIVMMGGTKVVPPPGPTCTRFGMGVAVRVAVLDAVTVAVMA